MGPVTSISRRSPLRYPGGKSRAVELLLRFLPEQPGLLNSVFFGAGWVELAAEARGWKVVGYDANGSLVDFWQVLLTDPHALADAVDEYFPLPAQRFYELQRSNFDSQLESAAAFYALNRTSFNGTTRSGGMSRGHDRFTGSSIEPLRRFRAPNLWVERADFRESIRLHPEALLLLDPPYPNSARLYGRRGDLHAGFDHQCLCDLLRSRDHWILSYSDCREVRALYDGYTILPLRWKYGMNRNKNASEIVILSHDLAERGKKQVAPSPRSADWTWLHTELEAGRQEAIR